MEVNEPAVSYGLFPKMSPHEYLAWERQQEGRHEYMQGEIVAMSGASLKHNRIQSTLIIEIGNSLKEKPCEAFVNDLRVEVKSLETYFYPDITIVCEELKIDDGKEDMITNPTVIIEILSPSTERKDMSKKKFFYMQIPSLKEYIMVDSTSVSVETLRKRQDGTWENQIAINKEDTLTIPTINFSISLQEIYSNVKL